MTKKNWSHKELCEIACKWLKRARNYDNLERTAPACRMSLSEIKTFSRGGEIVDAIGFRRLERSIDTVLVEAKTSLSDFNADKKKPWRKEPSFGVGNYRYFICPEGLIPVGKLPPKWGLIYVDSKGRCSVQAGHVLDIGRRWDLPDYKERIRSWRFDSNREAESSLYASLLVKMENVKEHVDLSKDNSRLRSIVDSQSIELQNIKRDTSMDAHNISLLEFMLLKEAGEGKQAELKALPLDDPFWEEFWDYKYKKGAVFE